MDYDWPVTLAPSADSFYLQHHTITHTSPFTRQMQVYGRSAPRWIVHWSLRGMQHTKAAALDGFLAKVRGPQNRVKLFDWRRPIARGAQTSLTAWVLAYAGVTFTFTDTTTFTDSTGFSVTGTGTPTIRGGAVGTSVVTLDGYAPNIVAFKAGDYIADGAGVLVMATDDATTDGSGKVNVPIAPPLRRDMLQGGAPVTTHAWAYFRLVSDDAGANPTTVDGLSTFEADFVEDL